MAFRYWDAGEVGAIREEVGGEAVTFTSDGSWPVVMSEVFRDWSVREITEAEFIDLVAELTAESDDFD